MGELAMRAVDVGPLGEQSDDLGLLPGEQPVDRMTARRRVVEPAGIAALTPAPRPTPVQLER